jgi:hypothetical protein
MWIDVWLRLQKKSSLPELTHHADAIGIQWYPWEVVHLSPKRQNNDADLIKEERIEWIKDCQIKSHSKTIRVAEVINHQPTINLS